MFLLVLLMTIFLVEAAHIEQSRFERNFELKYYAITTRSGPNATAVAVAGVSGQLWSPSTFGSIIVVDDMLLKHPNPYSQSVGRVQRLVVAASIDGRYNYVTLSAIFTSNEHNSSTLQAQGTFDRASREPSELSIVGGTGKFKRASGIAIVQTYDFLLFQAIFKFSLPK